MLRWGSKQPAKSYSYPRVMFPFTQTKAKRVANGKKTKTSAIIKGFQRRSRTMGRKSGL